MITTFKIFENLNSNYKVGDYVLMNIECGSSDMTTDFVNFVNTTPGKIYKITPEFSNHHGDFMYDDLLVLFEDDNVPNYIRFHMIRSNNIKGPMFKNFTSLDIKYFAETLEDLKIKIEQDKYNL